MTQLQMDDKTFEVIKKLDQVQIAGSVLDIQFADTALEADQLTGIPKLARQILTISDQNLLDQDASNNDADDGLPDINKLNLKEDSLIKSVNQSSKQAFIKQARIITDSKNELVSKVLELHLRIDDFEWDYRPGDAIQIYPHNDDNLVKLLLKRLGYSMNDMLQIQSSDLGTSNQIPPRCSAYDLFSQYLDICGPLRKALLRTLIECTQDNLDRRRLMFLCSKQGVNAFRQLQLMQPNLLDILMTFASCQPSLSQLVNCLNPLAPRSFSITSSLLHQQINAAERQSELPSSSFSKSSTSTELSICVKIVDNLTTSGNEGYSIRRRGVCSQYLISSLANSQSIHLKVQPRVVSHNNLFAIPDYRTDMILICTGTGIAPFMSFLRHRYAQQISLTGDKDIIEEERGKIYMFYGCRFRDTDLLYREELIQYLECGVITQLHVALSRDVVVEQGENYVKGPEYHYYNGYVQDAMLASHELIHQVCTSSSESKLFVCGSAETVLPAVRSTLTSILDSSSTVVVEVENCQSITLQQLQKSSRFICDIW
ncbi:hypothetical protein MIR68_011860 [Amoeboaphelidium protococcarum]|nr:hypothetical protein MIR68_011860 [Amoeboaphelidium protococcarum]